MDVPVTAPAIAQELKRTPETVRNWCRRLSVPLRTIKYPGPAFTDTEAMQLRELAALGHSTTSIAKQLGRTPRSIRVKAVALGISLRLPKQTNEIRFDIEREFLAILREAAAAYGHVTAARLVRHLVGLIAYENLFVALLGVPPPQQNSLRVS